MSISAMATFERKIVNTARRIPRFVFVASLAFCASCNLAKPLAVFIQPKRSVAAEFDKLGGSKVAILVWTDPSTYFDYPHVRFELATYVGDKLNAEMAQRNRPVEIVDARDVEDYVQKVPDAAIDPAKVGKQFNADYVVYLEITEFQIRDAQQPQFLRGKIRATVSVHDSHSTASMLRRFELTPVECVYPEKQSVLMTATNSPLVREAVYRKFAEYVSRKFYQYTEEA
ncbi:MAG: hypothetical protein HY287_08055 [Planctomycetes bacterium]|nr:hypothetical protein [Planctomycetota bacterium]